MEETTNHEAQQNIPIKKNPIDRSITYQQIQHCVEEEKQHAHGERR